MRNLDKLQEFKRIAKALNKIGSTPILYGSLGLSISIEHDIDTDDIDILVEDQIFKTSLSRIHTIIKSLGYNLTKPEENEFESSSFKIGIATDGDMKDFSGIDPTSLRIIHESANYRVLNPKQYLMTYETSNLDGYRKLTHKKDDISKIRLIKSIIIA